MKKDHVESAVQTGRSAAASPEKSPVAEPSVDVDVVQAQPNVFLVSDSPVAPATSGVLPDDAATSTGDAMKRPKAIAMERRLIIPVLPLV